jgi:class 3 adenylate cyclase
MADPALATSSWGLRFCDPRVEDEYQDWYLDTTRFYSRLGLIASVGIWTAVLVGLSLAIPDSFGRGGPYALAAVAVVLLALATTARRSLRAWVPVATAFANAFAGLAAIGFARAIVPDEDLPLAGMAMITLVFFGFVVFRLHPAVAAGAAATYVITFEVVLTVLVRDDEISTTWYWVTTVLVMTAYAAGLFICLLVERQMREQCRNEVTIRRQAEVIDDERQRADALLLNILPEPVADRLKRSQDVIAERFDDVTVLFADLVDFTPLAASVDAAEVVQMLNAVFSRFDELVREHGVEKIKTIGDAYMAVGGIPRPRTDHAQVVADLALDMRDAISTIELGGRRVELRIGLASGPAIAGVIGNHKFAYDLWGDTVNTAARMESHGIPGEIQVSESTHDLLLRTHLMTARGVIEIKGKGPTPTWLLIGRSDIPPRSGEGTVDTTAGYS